MLSESYFPSIPKICVSAITFPIEDLSPTAVPDPAYYEYNYRYNKIQYYPAYELYVVLLGTRTYYSTRGERSRFWLKEQGDDTTQQSKMTNEADFSW